jgi:hypothetical protein
MKVLPFTPRAAQAGIETNVTGTRALNQAKAIGALAGLVGGLVAGLFGALLTAASWFVINAGARHLFSTTGTVLLCLTIPLDPSLFVGAHESATTGLSNLSRSVTELPAHSLMETEPRPLRGRETIDDAMRALYLANCAEAPVVNDAGQLLGVIRTLDVLREWIEDTLLTQMGDETESFY